jgi:hypothetical protein
MQEITFSSGLRQKPGVWSRRQGKLRLSAEASLRPYMDENAMAAYEGGQ